MRTRVALAASAAGVLLVVLAAFGVTRYWTGDAGAADVKDVSPVVLLAGKDELPGLVTATGYAAVQNKDVTVPPVPRPFGADGFAFRSWGRSEGVPAFAQMVLEYSSSQEAEQEYDLAPYGRTYNDPEMGRLTPEPYAGAALRADSFKVACLRSPTDLRAGCSRWTFRARYGKYLVEVNFGVEEGARPVELDAETFDVMLASVDGHVGVALRD
ncbi:hypothetical protein Skr01_27270 [Sphaerisporangium krabiense]|uniref:Uncharacterized protein n=1 Tax=Sphaerisporangium krabiense TaxID=763782 RepID=A0A7W8ZAC2_9ACTN|nr:hypothetical protein [Sphaerisporangium krabiense]MBB5630404.1 hypothetical protein [Sphaerisporangium krabiense]GII62642.1 hypothetical protein Skr01_27270 [Sphaerisporangium krabiense]